MDHAATAEDEGSRMFDVRVRSNKVDVGSQPGTLWSLSSQKPGHGISQLRHANLDKLWQSDGTLPHVINIQFAKRTAVTHVSMYIDHVKDDSYTPTKVRILAGTHYHDLVEVRTRDFDQPQGWKHFVLDKKGSTNESDESDGYTSSSSSSSSGSSSASTSSSSSATSKSSSSSKSSIRTSHSMSHGATTSHGSDTEAQRQRRAARRLQKRGAIDANEPAAKAAGHVARGVSRKFAPIYTYYLQVCILANHSSGKDTHVRGLKVWGPPTKASGERVKRQKERRHRLRALEKRRREEHDEEGGDGRRVRGIGAGLDRDEEMRQKRRLEKQAQKARAKLLQWAQRDTPSTSSRQMHPDERAEGEIGGLEEEDASGWHVISTMDRDEASGSSVMSILNQGLMLR